MSDRLRRVRMIRRAALSVFIVFALLFSQAAAQLHALSHLAFDLAKTERGGEGPALPHPAGICVAFHAADNALPVLASAYEPPRLATPPAAALAPALLLPPRIAFDSRAPPYFS